MNISKPFLLLSFFVAIAAHANPLPLASCISSFKFTNSQWTINLKMDYYNVAENTAIDSVILITSTDTAYVLKTITDKMKIDRLGKTYTITKDSLNTNLLIKPAGDYLQIIVKLKASLVSFNETIVYGNYTNASVRALYDDEYYQSIYQSRFTICNTKSCQAVVKGHVYNNNGELIRNKTFDAFFTSNSFTTDDDGAYGFSAYTGSFVSVGNLNQGISAMQKDPTIHQPHSFPIDLISYNANPGDIIEKDIHLKTAFVSDVVLDNLGSQFFCSPNPAREQIVFSYSVENSISMNDVVLYIYDASGKLMDTLLITDRESTLLYGLDARFKA